MLDRIRLPASGSPAVSFYSPASSLLCEAFGDIKKYYIAIPAEKAIVWKPTKGTYPMQTRQEAIRHCLTYPDVYEDYPFHDPNWCVIRHRKNRRVFAWIFEREGHIWINVKCEPQWRDFWRTAFASVVPAYHLNKKHWNSIILDGSIPESDIRRMIGESYDLTEPVDKSHG